MKVLDRLQGGIPPAEILNGDHETGFSDLRIAHEEEVTIPLGRLPAVLALESTSSTPTIRVSWEGHDLGSLVWEGHEPLQIKTFRGCSPSRSSGGRPDMECVRC